MLLCVITLLPRHTVRPLEPANPPLCHIFTSGFTGSRYCHLRAFEPSSKSRPSVAFGVVTASYAVVSPDLQRAGGEWNELQLDRLLFRWTATGGVHRVRRTGVPTQRSFANNPMNLSTAQQRPGSFREDGYDEGAAAYPEAGVQNGRQSF